MYTLSSFVAGLVFGIGLIVSGLVNPAKVLGFLDLAGAWDPSLAVVMAGAVAVGTFAFAVAGKRASTLLGAPMALPTARGIDRGLELLRATRVRRAVEHVLQAHEVLQEPPHGPTITHVIYERGSSSSETELMQ